MARPPITTKSTTPRCRSFTAFSAAGHRPTKPSPRSPKATRRAPPPKAQSLQIESIALHNLLLEHDPSGRARGHAFRKTGVPPRIKSEGRHFPDHALGIPRELWPVS